MKENINEFKVITSISRAYYDIDLKNLYKKAKLKSKEISHLKGKKSEGKCIQYLNGLKFLIDEYCNSIKTSFEESTGIVIKSKNYDGVFSFFLAHALMQNKIHETEAFLNFHFQRCTVENKKEFINSIKFLIKEIIEKVDVFDNSELLSRIQNWAIEKEEAMGKMGKPENASIKFIINKNNQYAYKLIEFLSGKLKANQFTNLKKEFLFVFTKYKKINWLGTPSYLVYLIHRLVEDGYIVINHGENKKWEATLNYFEFYDTTGKKLTTKQLSDLLYNIISRSTAKYQSDRSNIDGMITSTKKFLENLAITSSR